MLRVRELPSGLQRSLFFIESVSSRDIGRPMVVIAGTPNVSAQRNLIVSACIHPGYEAIPSLRQERTQTTLIVESTAFGREGRG